MAESTLQMLVDEIKHSYKEQSTQFYITFWFIAIITIPMTVITV